MADTYDTSNPLKPTILKDPDATLDYSFNWATWLSAIEDTYSSHEFEVSDPSGANTPIVVESTLTASGETEDSPAVTVANALITAFVSGGTVGKTHTLTCRITTAGGRVDDRSVYLKIRQR